MLILERIYIKKVCTKKTNTCFMAVHIRLHVLLEASLGTHKTPTNSLNLEHALLYHVSLTSVSLLNASLYLTNCDSHMS